MRQATLLAVKETWYWYNNQKEFRELPNVKFWYGDT